MSKQNAIILILVIFLGALGGFLYFYFTLNNTPVVTNTTPAPVTTNTYDPFGTNASNNTIATTTTPIVPVTPVTNFAIPGKLRKISEEPVSGYSVFENTKTKRTDVHYILRANGNIYETYSDSDELRRLSITTITKVYESFWLPDNVRLIIRYLKDKSENIDTFSVKINPATTTLNEFAGGVDGNHLPENITAVAINPVGDKIFYLTGNLKGSSGIISNPDGLNKKLVFESPLIEWLVTWPKEEIITFNTKPSANMSGYLYFLNSQTGSFSKIIGGINGLTTNTSADASEVLYSNNISGTPKLYIFNVKSGESRALPWNTLPEKCVWGNTNVKTVYCAVPKTFPAGDYPDTWYQGLVNFTDDLWMIDTDTMTSTLLLDIERDTNNNIDAIDLKLDKNDNYLFFMNKTNYSLWSLKLN